MAKWLVSKHRSYNLDTIECIYVSNNYLMLTTDGGQESREVQFVYGTESELNKLHEIIMYWIECGKTMGWVLDCDERLKAIRQNAK